MTVNLYNLQEISEIKSVTELYEAKNAFKSTILLTLNHLLVWFCIFVLYLSTIKKSNAGLVFSILLLSLLFTRNFMVFHDLHHASYFPSHERTTKLHGLNRKIGDFLDVLYIWPGTSWRETHSTHHKTHGDLNMHDPARTFLSSSQYNKLSYTNQLAYDIFRHPIIFFAFIVPLWNSLLSNIIYQRYLYLGKTAVYFFIIYSFTNSKTLMGVLAAVYLANVIGGVLFHLQHAINNPNYWVSIKENDYVSKMNAELMGSSVLYIPYVLKPFTNGIEYHNVHHINPGVPSYNIRKCYEDLRNRGLLKNRTIGLKEMYISMGHTLYDEKLQKYI